MIYICTKNSYILCYKIYIFLKKKKKNYYLYFDYNNSYIHEI